MKNQYLPPQARPKPTMPFPNEQSRMPVWNSATVSVTPRVSPPTGYTRNATASTPSQAAANAQSWRVVSPPNFSYTGSKSSPSSGHSAPSVKHLTCYFWAKSGVCKWSEDECLYAHRDTGKIANGPLQVEPGCKLPSASRLVHAARADKQTGPAVAGKNATNARPVYEDWRGSLDLLSSPAAASRKSIEPEIQAQINYIAAKERARNASGSWTGLSARIQRLSDTLSPSAGDDHARAGAEPPASSHAAAAAADPELEESLQAVGRSISSMSRVLHQSQNAFHRVTDDLHHIGCGLLTMARLLEADRSRYADRVTHLVEEIVVVMADAGRVEAEIRKTEQSVTKDLDRFGLESLAAEWEAPATDGPER